MSTETKSLIAAVLAIGSYLPSSGSAAALVSGLGWHELPNTHLRSVCAADHGFPGIGGASGCDGITAAWSGGVFDSSRNRLIIWGGGHSDYYGNEMYALDLDTQQLTRLNDPGQPAGSSGTCQEAIANNTQPNSRHTYDGIEYIPGLDKMFVFSGSLACNTGSFGRDTWLFNFATMQWEKKNPSGTIPKAGPGVVTAYDPVSGLIYLYDDLHLYSYDPAADRYTQLTATNEPIGYHLNATIDPVRRKFVMVGYDSIQGAGRVWAIDLTAGSTYQRTALSTTGGGGIISTDYPGLEYDPIADRLVAWGQDSPTVIYSLNLDTRQWTTTTYAGNPAPVGQGTHGRWRYSAASGVFVLANSVDANVYFVRMSTGTISRPNPPTMLSAQ